MIRQRVHNTALAAALTVATLASGTASAGPGTLADAPPLNAARLVVDEIRLLGSRCGPFEPAIAALANGTIDPRPLVEAVYPLSRGVDAVEHAARPGALKVLVDPRNAEPQEHPA